MRFSSLVERIGGEGARAWDIHYRAVERSRRGEDVILLSVGDPDFATPSPIVEACVTGLRGGNTHYTDMTGQPALRAAIARRHAAGAGQAVSPEQVVVFSGAQNALFAAALCLLDRGDEVIAPDPIYVTYEAVIGASGANLVRVPLDRASGFHLDLDALAAAITPRTRAIMLNTPHNPTGVVLRQDEMEAVAALCRRHDLWLVSDEVYATLTYEQPHISPAKLPGMAERTIVVSSLSKSHAMTGWRVGWTIAPPDLVPHLANLALCMLYGLPGFVQDAAAVALSSEPDELAAMRHELRARRDLVCARLAQIPGVECLRPEGAMFVMLDIRETGLSAQDFAERLLDEHAVSVLPADAFGPTARGHVRIGLVVDRDRLSTACDRIAALAGSLAVG